MKKTANESRRFGSRAKSLLITRLRDPSIMRRVVERAASRSLLNHFYHTLSDTELAQFHSRFAKLFRDNPGHPAPGSWVVYFEGRKITLPLREDWFWLDWDTAVSILGHDIEIKKTYRNLLSSNAVPDLFVDIGANYGTHSLLFLAAGVPTLSFEPNETCFNYFDICCRYNNLTPAWKAMALGSVIGVTSLSFSERDTWLGSVSKHTAGQRVVTVPSGMLDTHLPELAGKRVLIKIDTEGGELAVLEGAYNVLRLVSPTIIFESNSAEDRPAIYGLLRDHGYRVAILPYVGENVEHLSRQSFLASSAANFMAVI